MGVSWRDVHAPMSIDPVYVEEHQPYPLLASPFAPLIFPNSGQSSNARDNCAIERTFLSWLRLAMYMAIVSVAILVNFHLKNQPTVLERAISFPVGIIFWVLSLACLLSGCANYFSLVNKFACRRALAQTGWKTQVVFTVVATSIVAGCVLFLSTNVEQTP